MEILILVFHVDYIKHKDTKGRSFFLDTKITSDLKVATKPCGGLFFADGNLCDLCQVALAALCIFVDY